MRRRPVRHVQVPIVECLSTLDNHINHEQSVKCHLTPQTYLSAWAVKRTAWHRAFSPRQHDTWRVGRYESHAFSPENFKQKWQETLY